MRKELFLSLYYMQIYENSSKISNIKTTPLYVQRLSDLFMSLPSTNELCAVISLFRTIKKIFFDFLNRYRSF